MLKIELQTYNRSALRHIGAALVAIAADLEVEYKDKCDCAGAKLGYTEPQDVIECPIPPVPTEQCAISAPTMQTFGPTPPLLDESRVSVISPTMMSNGATITSVIPPAPPAEVIDDEDGWPDPPGAPQQADGLDAAGIPWDVRIHAGSKTRLKADNTWKLKPGVDKALVEQVKAELLGVQAATVSTSIHAPMQTVAQGAATMLTVPAPPAPTLADAVAVSATLQAPPAPVAGPANFAELIKEVTTRISAGSMTADQVNGAVSQVTGGQLTMCNQLAARQDLIPAVWSVLCPTVV